MIGETFGPYTILEKLGAGAMGEVYKARHNRLNRFVAIKALPVDRATDPEWRRRLAREAQAVSALNHPNIVGVYDILSQDGRDLLIMEFVAGRTLDRLIPPKGLDLKLALQYAIPIADALAAAHAAGMAHRDLKPANVMIGDEGVVKLLDFGLAKRVAPNSIDAQTAEGLIVGTLSYMSPEQADGKPVDFRSDIFSFGAMLYEMLTGSRAFAGDSTASTLMAVIHHEPASLRTFARDVPLSLEAIVMRCLRKNPALRFQNALELKSALEGLCAESTSQRQAARREPPSIAVLPFSNLSADRENEYFSDGLAEDIINALARMPGLRVASRTSAFAFRGIYQDILEIGQALKVSNVLEGSVRRAGNRVRVSVQLIGLRDGFQLWSERYDREMTDIFAIQDEISQAIASALKVKLSHSGQPAVERQTRNVEAYNLYLKGRYLLRKFTLESNEKAKEYLAQALALDPAYTLARVAAAICDVASGVFGWAAPNRVLEDCKRVFQKTLQIDDTVVDAHWAFGALLALFDHDWTQAEREYKRALELDPDSPQAHWTYGFYFLRPLGRREEAFLHVKRAAELDPLAIHYPVALGELYRQHLEYDLAVDQFRAAIEMDTGFHMAHALLGLTYSQMGLFEEAGREIEHAAGLAGREPFALGAVGAAHALAGRERDALKIVSGLERLSADSYVPPGAIAWIYAALNESGKAVDWFEKAVEARDPSAVWLPADPAFGPLRSDPRYWQLLRRMRLAS